MDGESHGRAPCIFQVINDVGILLDDAFAYVFNHGDIKMLRERENEKGPIRLLSGLEAEEGHVEFGVCCW